MRKTGTLRSYIEISSHRIVRFPDFSRVSMLNKNQFSSAPRILTMERHSILPQRWVILVSLSEPIQKIQRNEIPVVSWALGHGDTRHL